MKRKIVIFSIFVLFITAIYIPFFYKKSSAITTSTTTAEKGDLRCPNIGKNCKEIKVGNKVNEVQITATKEMKIPVLNIDGTYQTNSVNTIKTKKVVASITKVVKKTSTVGDYEISFKSNIDAPKASKKCIAVVLDNSDTIKSSYQSAMNAIVNFSTKFKETPNNLLALYTFADKAIIKRNFSPKKFSSFEREGSFSHIELAYERGQKLYSLDKNAKRRFSHENQDVQKMYEEYFVKPNSPKSHMLLHTEHKLEGF